MKTSGIISFVLMLILGLATLFLSLSMEVVLKSANILIICSLVIIILSILTFIFSLREKYKIMKWVGGISILASIVLLFTLMILVADDTNAHRELMNKRTMVAMFGFISLVATAILGIVNTILAFTKKTK